MNPHILPFTYAAEGSYGAPNLWRRGRGGWRGGFLLSTLEMALKEDMLKWLRLMRVQRLGPVLAGVDWSHVFLQDNQGDVTLSPTAPLIDYFNVINNASSQAQIERMVAEGEQVTWRAMSMISHRIRIQRLIDGAIDDPLLTSQPAVLRADPPRQPDGTQPTGASGCHPTAPQLAAKAGPDRMRAAQSRPTEDVADRTPGPTRSFGWAWPLGSLLGLMSTQTR